MPHFKRSHCPRCDASNPSEARLYRFTAGVLNARVSASYARLRHRRKARQIHPASRASPGVLVLFGAPAASAGRVGVRKPANDARQLVVGGDAGSGSRNTCGR